MVHDGGYTPHSSIFYTLLTSASLIVMTVTGMTMVPWVKQLMRNQPNEGTNSEEPRTLR